MYADLGFGMRLAGGFKENGLASVWGFGVGVSSIIGDGEDSSIGLGLGLLSGWIDSIFGCY